MAVENGRPFQEELLLALRRPLAPRVNHQDFMGDIRERDIGGGMVVEILVEKRNTLVRGRQWQYLVDHIDELT